MNLEEISKSISEISIGPISLKPILSALFVFLVCYIAIKIIMRIVKGLLDKSKAEDALKSFVKSGVKAALWLIAIIIVADKLGIETASLVALLSVAGLALSLSIQGIMSNLFSGMTILITKPFASGDFVELDGKTGTVTSVGLFYTQLSTADNIAIFVPNSQVTSTKINNYNRQKIRRVDLHIDASYEEKTETVKTALLDVARGDKRVLEDPVPFAGIMSYKDSSIEYVLRAWVDCNDYLDTFFALNEKIREIFEERGIKMTFQHLNVHLIDK